MPPDFSFMISRYLYPVSKFQPTHVHSQKYLCLCLSSTPQFLPPTVFSGCYGNRDEITKSRRTSCPPDRLPSAFYYSYIMIPHPCSHAQCAWQDNRSPYLPELPGAPCSYAHRQSSPVHMILETYTLHNHSC